MAEKMELVALLQEAVKEATDTAHGTKEPRISRGVFLEVLDKKPSTFDNELNPWPNPDCRNKLGLEDAFKIMALSGDTRLLASMAGRLGFTLRHMAEACPDKPTLPEELLDDLPAVAAFHEAIRQGMPLEAVQALMQNAIRDLEQDFVAYRGCNYGLQEDQKRGVISSNAKTSNAGLKRAAS